MITSPPFFTTTNKQFQTTALFRVMPRMAAVAGLMGLISYVYAVMFTELFRDLYPIYTQDYNYFGTLLETSLTLLQITTLDNWADLGRSMMNRYTWAWVPLLSYIIIIGFIVVNLIIAIVCDAVSALREDDKAKLHGTSSSTPHQQQQLPPHDYSDYDESNNDMQDTLNQHQQHKRDHGWMIYQKLKQLEGNVNELTLMQNQTILALEAMLLQSSLKSKST